VEEAQAAKGGAGPANGNAACARIICRDDEELSGSGMDEYTGGRASSLHRGCAV
jgi:hypothetical protein